MIGYSVVSDNAYAPGPSNSIYISKTNQKLSISYIPTLRHYRFFFRNKSLDQRGVSILSENFSLLQFTLYQYILRYGVYVGLKINVIPYPSMLNYKLSVRTATSDQLTKTDVGIRTFLQKLNLTEVEDEY